jgi:hypothetical protein
MPILLWYPSSLHFYDNNHSAGVRHIDLVALATLTGWYYSIFNNTLLSFHFRIVDAVVQFVLLLI